LSGVCFTGKVLVFPGAKGSSGWSGFFQATRLLGTAPLAMVFTTLSAKSALGAVVTRVPTVSDLANDPVEIIHTGDWVVVDADRGIVTVACRMSCVPQTTHNATGLAGPLLGHQASVSAQDRA
jgi:uncharacterized protein